MEEWEKEREVKWRTDLEREREKVREEMEKWKEEKDAKWRADLEREREKVREIILTT